MKIDDRGQKYTLEFSSCGSLCIELVNDQKEIKIPNYALENLHIFLNKHFNGGTQSDLLDEIRDLVHRYARC